MKIDDLYALPADEFVAARDALAKELRAGGDRDAAAEVKALPRPNAIAAALNALARDGEVLDAIWSAAASARGGAAVRDAIEAAIARVEGASAATLDGVRRVLQDAAADPGVREQVATGRLSRAPSADDTDPLAAWAASLGETPPSSKPRKAKGPAKRPRQTTKGTKGAADTAATSERAPQAAREAERRSALEARLAEAVELRDETARAATAARRIAGERREELDAARAEAERARAAAADAQKAARDAQAQAEEAASALERAERTVRRLRGELDG